MNLFKYTSLGVISFLLLSFSLNADMDYLQYALQSGGVPLDISDIKSCVQLAQQNDPDALNILTIFAGKCNSNQAQALHIFQHLSYGIMNWESRDEVGNYSNTLQNGSWIYSQGNPSSAQVLCLDSCGNRQEKSYKNAGGWWKFDWENSDFITNCDGRIINGSTTCDHSHLGCHAQVHRFTSYLYNPANPTVGLLKSDYIFNPQNYPQVTNYLLSLPV